MRKTIVSLALSKDGFIADLDGNTLWLHDENLNGNNEEQMKYFEDLINSVDVIIMGKSAFEVTWGYVGTKWSPKWMYSNHITYVYGEGEDKPNYNIYFIKIPPKELMKNLQEIEGKDILLFGGGRNIETFLEEGLVDKAQLTYVNVERRKGIPLWRSIDPTEGVKPVKVKVNGDFTTKWFEFK